MSEKYISPKEAVKILGVHWMTLKNWESKGYIDCIKTPSGKRMYNVEKYLQKFRKLEENTKRRICYCRVSTRGQSNDLERQIDYMKSKYPDYELEYEIGSGLNFNRRKFKKIVDAVIRGDVAEIVVAHRDRLTRFGFDFFENLIKQYSDGKITVINNEKLSPEEEVTMDLLSIINVFSARVNGLRKYEKQIKKEKYI
jgi:predicted site-specific integrase-resolvase